MSVLLFRTVANNPRKHPLSLGLLYLYCPAAAYWWRVGVEIEPPFDPVWQAIEDYAVQPPHTLREYLEERGLKVLLDEARKYVDQVKTTRQRLPHIVAPELLPTFPGGKLPLRVRFGIKEPLAAIGGADGFFAYVRTWAFLIQDWMAKVPFENIRIEPLWVAVRFDGLRAAYRLPAWAFFPADEERRTPYVLGVPPGGPDAMATLYLFAQSPDKHPWEHEPQVWRLHLDGRAEPVDPPVSPQDTASALMWLGERAERARSPFPLASLASPWKCASCVFREMCLDDGARKWTPQAAAVFGESS